MPLLAPSGSNFMGFGSFGLTDIVKLGLDCRLTLLLRTIVVPMWIAASIVAFTAIKSWLGAA
jgi:hypothetical protein